MEQSVTKNLANADVYKVFQAPRVGLEPTTPRLTAACSTIELSRIILFSCTFSSVCDRVVALPLSYRGLSFYSLLLSLFLFLYTFKTTHEESLYPILTALPLSNNHLSWLCPRPISDGQLHTLLHFHLRPIYLVLFKGSY